VLLLSSLVISSPVISLKNRSCLVRNVPMFYSTFGEKQVNRTITTNIAAARNTNKNRTPRTEPVSNSDRNENAVDGVLSGHIVFDGHRSALNSL